MESLLLAEPTARPLIAGAANCNNVALFQTHKSVHNLTFDGSVHVCCKAQVAAALVSEIVRVLGSIARFLNGLAVCRVVNDNIIRGLVLHSSSGCERDLLLLGRLPSWGEDGGADRMARTWCT